MRTPNPWTVVPAADYEAHMGPAGVDQLAPLSQLFQEAYVAAQPDRVLVLGCATGNGLEHVDPNVTKRIVGVDVSLQYLGIARQRFFHLGPRLELYCSDAERFQAAEGPFDLVHAALVLEYAPIDAVVERIAGWLAARGTCSVVLEVPGGEPARATSRGMQIVQRFGRPVDPEALTARFARQGVVLRRARAVPLRSGGHLWAGAFGR